jgi:23S rRNA maturation-related 3'-5' exoribonuclease YhaM
MSPITVNFTDEERVQITMKAKESGMSDEELVRLTVQSVVFSAENDDFDGIKLYLLEKYGNVYRKLA